ncbi:MAG: DUF4886 domain-containing protein [Bacilli bacterium]|nr:DUF4886 domain-containing protein [Bacilli bacterium]
MKVLAVGNSFSTDATTYLEHLANDLGRDLFVRNLFIGGCSLKQHHDFFTSGAPAYEYQKDGILQNMISLKGALELEKWDVITLQQASHDSGIISTYEPHIGFLVSKIHELAPQAKIMFHRTWAYEVDSDHPGFLKYDQDQSYMFERIVEATNKIAKKYDLDIIPSGDLIQSLRKIPEFDYANGGLSLCRDGFHLSETYGRYAAALLWLVTLTGHIDRAPSVVGLTAKSELIDIIFRKVKEVSGI